jgi:hypothetical protein
VIPALLVIVLFVVLPIASIWFGVESRDRTSGAAQW